MSVLISIETKLRAAFPDATIRVIDESAPHAGHAGAAAHGGEVSHVGIAVVSDCFAGVSRVERQRMVFAAMGDDVRKVHAIDTLKTLTVEEAGKSAKGI